MTQSSQSWPARPMSRRRRRLAAGVALAIGVAGLAACTTDPEPTPTVTTEPTTPTQPPGPTIDPDEPSTEFALPTGTQVWVSGVLTQAVDGISGPGDPRASFTVSGEGFDDIETWGDLGQVAEIPDWGLLTVEEVEGDPVTDGGGRPPTVLHFRAVTDFPLEFTSTFALEIGGTLVITDLLIEIQKDGTATDGIADFTINPGTTNEIQVEGPAGTVVEVPDWGTIGIVEPEAGEAGDNGRAPLWIQTVTDFPVLDESPI